MPVDDLLGDPQPKACADICFGREKRFEDLIHIFERYSGTIVFNFHFDEAAVYVFRAMGADDNDAISADRVGSIGNQI